MSNFDILFMDKKDKIDVCLYFGSSNRFYFTRFNSSNGCVILFPNKMYFLTDSRYQIGAEEALKGQGKGDLEMDIEIVICPRSDMSPNILDIISGYKVKNIGFEDDMPHSQFLRLKEYLKGYSFKSITKQTQLLRSIKTDAEIELISASQAVNELALSRVLKYIKSGHSEREIAAEILYAMVSAGAEKPSFDAIVAIAENSAKPHSTPSSRVLEKGDHIMIDMGAVVNGYCSDMTRCFSVGQPSKEIAKIYADVLGAQEYALKNIKAGITASEADSFAREFLFAKGYQNEFSHSLGHGVGVDIHELPWVSGASDTELAENMVITVEPGIYLPSLGGIRIEDLVVVTKNGVRNLTNFSKEFIL